MTNLIRLSAASVLALSLVATAATAQTWQRATLEQAAQLRALMASLKIERAHIVGHSSGGNIALQLALDSPERVQSIALLEAAMPVPPSTPGRGGIPKAMELYRAGDKAAAVDTFMQAVAGSGYRAVLDRALPQAFAQAAKEADTFFGQELPAIGQWTFTPDDARRIGQPVLLVMGADSRQVSPFRIRAGWPNGWLPSSRTTL